MVPWSLSDCQLGLTNRLGDTEGEHWENRLGDTEGELVYFLYSESARALSVGLYTLYASAKFNCLCVSVFFFLFFSVYSWRDYTEREL
jgi:hypothetical protein